MAHADIVTVPLPAPQELPPFLRSATFPGDAVLVDFTTDGGMGNNGSIVYFSRGVGNDPDVVKNFEIIGLGGVLAQSDFSIYRYVGRVFRGTDHSLLFEIRP